MPLGFLRLFVCCLRSGRGRRELRAEFAGGEVVEGAEAAGELSIGQAALAVELAEMIRGGAFAFQRIAFHTRQDEVAVGIAPIFRARHDVIEAPLAGVGPSETIKTPAMLPRVDGWAQPCILEKIHFFQIALGLPSNTAILAKVGPQRANLAWQMHLDQVTLLAPFDQAQSPEVGEAAHGVAACFSGNAHAAGQPAHREAEAKLSLKPAVPQEKAIDRAVRGGEAQARRENILKLFPHTQGIGYFAFHGSSFL